MDRNSTPKPPEHLQAQIEAFSDKGVRDFSEEQEWFLRHSAELAKITNLDELPQNIPPELAKLIELHRKNYIVFLCKEKREELQYRKENVEHYKKNFQSAIRTLKEKMKQTDTPKILPDYLGSGSNGDVYRIEVNGKEYAAKFNHYLTQANFELKPLLRAKGTKHAAQLAAYSFEDGVIIMELLPGTDVTNFTPEHAPEYSDEHIIQLIETVQKLNQNGLMIDPKPSNFLYDKKGGFSVLDFHMQGESRYSLADSIMDLRIALTARKWPQLDWRAGDYEEKFATQNLERNKIYLPIMVRFLTILQEKFPDILEDWKRGYAEREANPSISQTPPIDRSSMQTNHPDIAPHLKRLEEMGF
ncbi:hypothetical protein COW95_00015 [Candidatus Peregrinibacteria bacterium CG22_combo_CG10-13_8_21_14_all_49_11]|nr:MAG: hypothetical protein COW95_00015 [Candidatus Peregrinibacteria bacterium CG22_combo_CG10-13_8_21_14_all_49_11]